MNKIIAVVGTTASGKTDLAIELAKEFGAEAISVDSRQIYREMDIGTAKEPGQIRHWMSDTRHPMSNLPDDSPVTLEEVLANPYEIQGIPHYMIDVVNPDQVLTLAHFQALAFGVIDDIIARGKVPILVGGTGLYTSAIIENWKIPEVMPDPNLRQELEDLSDAELMTRLDKVDHKKTETIDLKNRRRMIRAIEIASQGKINKSKSKLEPKYDSLLIGLAVDREVLNDRVNQRVDRMIKEGLVDEVKQVGDKYGYDTVAMTGQGYQQIGWHLQGKISLEEAIEETKKATRNYAKRQMTWWRKHGPVDWVNSTDKAIKLVKQFLR